jgi:TRAP-type C4-dicarboxylate transport system permease small subunit
MTWISSGWTGIAHLNVVDASNNQLAYCEFMVVTSYQTSSASGNIFTQTPSAKVALGIFLAALAAILVGCCLCCCNRQRQARNKKFKYQTDSDYSRMQGDLA